VSISSDESADVKRVASRQRPSTQRGRHEHARRTKDEYAILPSVGTRKTCTVSFRDSDGVQHSVEVGAETLYEAAVLALKSFRDHECAPGPAAHLAVEVKNPSVTHTVVAHKIEEWLDGGARSPKEAIEKRRLRQLLDG
jgi:hypothetical protein